jgi:hypothetical protein
MKEMRIWSGSSAVPGTNGGKPAMAPGTVAPMLSAGAGLDGEDPETVLRRCIDALVGFAAGALDQGQDPPAA